MLHANLLRHQGVGRPATLRALSLAVACQDPHHGRAVLRQALADRPWTKLHTVAEADTSEVVSWHQGPAYYRACSKPRLVVTVARLSTVRCHDPGSPGETVLVIGPRAGRHHLREGRRAGAGHGPGRGAPRPRRHPGCRVPPVRVRRSFPVWRSVRRRPRPPWWRPWARTPPSNSSTTAPRRPQPTARIPQSGGRGSAEQLCAADRFAPLLSIDAVPLDGRAPVHLLPHPLDLADGPVLLS